MSVLLPLAVMAIFIVVLIHVQVQLVTTRRKLQKTEQANEVLGQSDRLNKEVFAVITHDFKEPLISFRLMLDQIGKADGNMTVEQLLEIRTQLDHTFSSLRNFTDWAVAEMKCPDQQPLSISLRSRSEKIIRELMPLAKAKKIQIENRIPEETMWNIHGCVLQVTLRNLLTNAIKFSPEGKTVIVEVGAGGLEVRDQGQGLSEELKEALFKSRVLAGYGTHRENGFGVGLYLTGRLLEKSGFAIAAENLETGGARFVVHPPGALPFEASEQLQPSAA